MECQQCKFCSKLVKLEQSRPATEGRVCDACRWKALPKCGVGTCKTSQRKQKNLKSLPSIFFSLGDVGKKQVLDCFKIGEEHVLCCSSCYTKVHQMVRHTITYSQQTPSASSSESAIPLTTNDNDMPSIGRPRVPYNRASARTKCEILKKATKIYNESDRNLKTQIDEISQGCSEEVLMDISCPKMSPSKVGL